MQRFTKKEFLSSGSWTCPAGVTKVFVQAYGGGGGGSGAFIGSGSVGGQGGIGCIAQTVILDVVPNTTYTITVGSGGTGGISPSFSGADGGDTSFGALMVWKGGQGGRVNSSFSFDFTFYRFRSIVTSTDMSAYPTTGVSRTSQHSPYPGTDGKTLPNGTPSGLFYGGTSGMSGEGPGGQGGNGNSSGVGGDGSSALANSGGGGGGAGVGTTGTPSGGTGGSGKLTILWVE